MAGAIPDHSAIRDEGEDCVVFWKEDGGESPVFSDKLTPQQAGELTMLLQEFSDVLCNEPGLTTITEHGIDTDTTRPIRLLPYRLPHTYQDTVKSELEKKGIIER